MRMPWKIAAGVMWLVVIALMAYLFIRPTQAEPERLYALNDFQLTTHTGETLDTEELRGAPWVAMLFLTECPSGACPMMMQRMQDLLEAVPDPRVRIVSITADPAVDTPEQLAAYAETIGADKERWTFATGSQADIEKAARHLYLGLAPHDERFVLFDDQNRAVGLYHRSRDEEMEQLRKDVSDLLGS